MSGGGGGGGEGSGIDRNGVITLEDLESFTEDQLSDSGNGSLEDGEAMEEEDSSDRLLHYWQEVARGHQVEVSHGKNKQVNLDSNMKATLLLLICLEKRLS